MENLMPIIGLVAIIVVPIMLIMWSRQKEELGTIKCKRCNHVGPAKGMFVPFRGMKPVCQECQSDDWVKVDWKNSQSEPAEPAAPPVPASTKPAASPPPPPAAAKHPDACPSCGRVNAGKPKARYCIVCDLTY